MGDWNVVFAMLGSALAVWAALDLGKLFGVNEVRNQLVRDGYGFWDTDKLGRRQFHLKPLQPPTFVVPQSESGTSPNAGLVAKTRLILQQLATRKGHDRCWYNPEVLRELLDLHGIELSADRTDLPSEDDFAAGCNRFRRELYGKTSANIPRTVELTPRDQIVIVAALRYAFSNVDSLNEALADHNVTETIEDGHGEEEVPTIRINLLPDREYHGSALRENEIEQVLYDMKLDRIVRRIDA